MPLRFVDAGDGCGNLEALNRIHLYLCTRGTPKEGAYIALKRYIDDEAHDLNALVESSDADKNLRPLRAIDELIELVLGERASRASRFYNYIRTVSGSKFDHKIIIFAKIVSGHLARAGGSMTADEVEHQVALPADRMLVKAMVVTCIEDAFPTVLHTNLDTASPWWRLFIKLVMLMRFYVQHGVIMQLLY
ncbi:hypothetical protein Nepgr_025533 [Nepenthes gracilis]|uniref:Uncharacterized protein n=1 Tax=Nepenthes gracilis TaxID=150966 RepID=A0AAD3T5A3_NEPGR|nr:hypothetical protein Nepgr_025533 [Nepenthes gracilis]